MNVCQLIYSYWVIYTPCPPLEVEQSDKVSWTIESSLTLEWNKISLWFPFHLPKEGKQKRPEIFPKIILSFKTTWILDLKSPRRYFTKWGTCISEHANFERLPRQKLCLSPPPLPTPLPLIEEQRKEKIFDEEAEKSLSRAFWRGRASHCQLLLWDFINNLLMRWKKKKTFF